jgi:protein SCO1/2
MRHTACLALAVSLSGGPALAGSPLPFDVGGPFELTDQHGDTRTDESYRGKPALLFFGYAQCQSICSVALPRMAEAVDLLDEAGTEVQPILITVDPARDTPEALAAAAPDMHPRLSALTGTDAALAAARKSYRVESKRIGEDVDGPIYAHGSFIYLLGPDGEVLSLMPPVLAPERMAEITLGYLK